MRELTIDWTRRENVSSRLPPPDKQEAATRTVLEQAEALSAGWAT